MNDLLFLKLGGSLITDKTGVEQLRGDVLQRLAAEIAQARAANPHMQLVLGHGSGSFGHVAAAKYGTRAGVASAAQWHGFAEVALAASRLNQFVRAALLAEGVPCLSVLPSSSAQVQDGTMTELAVAPIKAALAAGLVPLVMGDVAFDSVRGGTIVSTEEVMGYLAAHLQPDWLLLAGETDGVFDQSGTVIELINHANFAQIEAALGGSRGTDVTGGMHSKVAAMLALVTQFPALSIRIFSGLEIGRLAAVLAHPAARTGTEISR